MKKLLIAMCAGALCASAEVASQTVGYTAGQVAADTYYMVGVQFEETAGTAGQIAIDDLVVMLGIDAQSFDDSNLAPQILLWDGADYSYLYYLSDAYNSSLEEVTGWANGNGDIVEQTFNIGDGFWFKAPVATSASAVAVKGQVSAEASKTVPFGAGLSIIASPFPAATSLTDVTVSGVSAVSFDNSDDAAQIMLYVDNNYTFYYYLSDAYNSSLEEVTGWADGNGDIVEGDIIAAGTSFWVRSASAGSLTFTR